MENVKEKRIKILMRKVGEWKEKSRQRAIVDAGKNTELYKAQYKAAVAKAKLEKVRKQSGGSGGFVGAAENFNRNIGVSPIFQPMGFGQPQPKEQKVRYVTRYVKPTKRKKTQVRYVTRYVKKKPENDFSIF